MTANGATVHRQISERSASRQRRSAGNSWVESAAGFVSDGTSRAGRKAPVASKEVVGSPRGCTGGCVVSLMAVTQGGRVLDAKCTVRPGKCVSRHSGRRRLRLYKCILH